MKSVLVTESTRIFHTVVFARGITLDKGLVDESLRKIFQVSVEYIGLFLICEILLKIFRWFDIFVFLIHGGK